MYGIITNIFCISNRRRWRNKQYLFSFFSNFITSEIFHLKVSYLPRLSLLPRPPISPISPTYPDNFAHLPWKFHPPTPTNSPTYLPFPAYLVHLPRLPGLPCPPTSPNSPTSPTSSTPSPANHAYFTYLPTYLAYLSTYLLGLSTRPPTHISTPYPPPYCLLSSLPAYPPPHPPILLPTRLPSSLPAYPPPYPPTCYVFLHFLYLEIVYFFNVGIFLSIFEALFITNCLLLPSILIHFQIHIWKIIL